MNAVFDVTDFLHPQDISARQQLERVPLLQKGVKAYLSTFTDRRVRQWMMSNSLRLGPRQLPHVYRLLPPICEALGIDEPELYLTRGDANAYTVGHDRTAIVLQNGLLEDLQEEEITAVLAHECGHIMAEHILYRQMAQALVRAGESAGAIGGTAMQLVTALGSKQVEAALLTWYRKSELTADRAAVAFMGGAEPMQRALFHIVGVPQWQAAEVSPAAFLEQADEFEEVAESSWWDRYISRRLDAATTHPMPALRMRELTSWAQSERFAQVSAMARAAGFGQPQGRPCERCGHSVPDEWKFCQSCGEATLHETVKEPTG